MRAIARANRAAATSGMRTYDMTQLPNNAIDVALTPLQVSADMTQLPDTAIDAHALTPLRVSAFVRRELYANIALVRHHHLHQVRPQANITGG